MKYFLFLVFLITLYSFSVNAREDYVKVHFICHSHDDSGWLKTFEGYYDSHVSHIIDSVIENLEKSKERKFIWSEIGFLDRWWRANTPEKQNRFTTLLKNGQIEFANGGWVMNDEACPTVDAIIRHLADGHRFIVEHFGKEYLPVTGWQIDPFGHSAVMPYLQSQMGYKHLILNRIWWQHHDSFKKNKNLQFIWRGSPDTLGPKSDIFTYVVDDFYVSPPDLNMEDAWRRQQSTDQLVNHLMNIGQSRGQFYESPHVLVPLGGDFNYVHAEYYFDKIDPVIEEINRKFENGQSKVKAVYSTMAQFFNETITWHQEHNVPFKYFDEDFFPYAERQASWWTGYFTTRPLLKGQIRSVSSKIRSAEIFSSFQNADNFSSLIQDASHNASILQHHDAITGTARPEVVDDYAHRLNDADSKLNQVLTKTMSNIVVDQAQAPLELTAIKEYPELDYITFDSGKLKSIVISNSLNWNRRDVYTVKISTTDTSASSCPYSVSLGTDTSVFIQSDCALISEKKIEKESEEVHYYKVDFYVDIPAFGIKTYYLHKEKSELTHFVRVTKEVPANIYNQQINLEISKTNYLLETLTDYETNEKIALNQKLMDYQDNGGAYIMLSYSEAVEPQYESREVQFYNGLLSKEYHVYYTYSRQKILVKFRLYNTTDSDLNKKLNFEFKLQGREGFTTVNRFATSLKTTHVYSDSGLELHKRDQTKNLKEPHINYYPSISIGMIRDENTETSLACIGDRARGVASMKSGEFEFAMHRNLNRDDQKGLDYPQLDKAWINVKTECYVGHFYKMIKSLRHESLRVDNPLRGYSVNASSPNNNIDFTGINHRLPDNIHFMSLERSGDDEYTVRAMNIREEGPPTSFEITNLFSFHNGISSLIRKEFNLNNLVDYSANEILDYIPHNNISVVDFKQREISNYPPRFTPILSKSTVTLNPLEIKSFSISLRK